MRNRILFLLRALHVVCCWALMSSFQSSDLHMVTPRVLSDYLYLDLSPSSLGGDIMGVFASTDIPAEHFLCEYRGLIVPESYQVTDIYRMSFKISTPDGRKLVLISSEEAEDNICIHINDCVLIHDQYTAEDVAMLERKEAFLPTTHGLEHNAVIQVEGSKVFIMSSRTIAKGEEIFYAFGSEFWIPHILRWKEGEMAGEIARDDVVPSSSSGAAIESDLLLVYPAPSSLGEHVGKGLFARTDIPIGTILCEYRGAILDLTDVKSDYGFNIPVHGGRPNMAITAEHGAGSVAMYVNDCVSIGEPFSVEEVERIQRQEQELPLLPGCAYNSQAQRDGSKVFVVATQDISAGKEIFYAYGSAFWLPRLAVEDSDSSWHHVELLPQTLM